MRIRARSLLSLAILLGVLVPLALMNSRAHAFVYVVNTTVFSPSTEHCSAADGPCSLWNAIDSANINPGADTIVFDQSVFTPGTTINVVSPLPYVDTSEGITIDGSSPNNVIIKDVPAYSSNFGLAFVSDGNAQNITVSNITVQNFNYDGIQVCPRPNVSTCDGSTSNVNFENVVTEFNTHDGIDILGTEINTANLDHVISAFNQHIGIDIDSLATGGLDSLSITNSNSGFNTDGDIHFRASRLGGLQMTDTVASMSDHDGILIDVHDVESATLTRVDSENNPDSGISFHSDYKLSNITVSDSKVTNSGTGVSLVADGGSSSMIQSATIQNNNLQGEGIRVDSENGAINGVIVQGNTVQGAAGNGVTFSTVFGLGGSGNVVQGNTVTTSTNDAIHVTGGSNITVTISQNATALSSGLGINLNTYTTGNGVNINDPGDADTGANTFLNYPVITSADGQFVQGTACANCLVEIFHSDSDSSGYGEGAFFEGDGVATGSGQFVISLCGFGLQAGAVLTSTATDVNGNTSEFSANFPTSAASDSCPTPTPSPPPIVTPSPVTTATHTPSPTPTLGPGQHLQGDLTCDNHINGLDALLALDFATGITQPAGGTCPAVGSGSPKFGDVNCDGAVDEHDAVAILTFAAGARPLPQHEPCTNVGAIL